LLLQQLLDDAKAVEPRHLHIKEDQLGTELADQAQGLKPVLALAHQLDIREAFEEEHQLIAGGLLVIHDHCSDFHEGAFPSSRRPRPYYNKKPSAISPQQSAFSFQLSAFSRQLLAFSLRHKRRSIADDC